MGRCTPIVDIMMSSTCNGIAVEIDNVPVKVQQSALSDGRAVGTINY